ncbi:MAG TPA: aspartyl/asparaginyl beta-hydroxylase domain-containing protein [Streptosporangiaceae bacterium]|nr:aspartyl/asparaginyl beta-hydroxylase domain-containing protein [Streptosporangiaceae bacterium]
MPVALTGQIAHLEQIDKARAARLRHEALTAPVPWTAEYGLYQSGGWWTASLMNDTGNAADVTIRDCAARPTELLKHMPATAELLAELGLSYMWVRLARLEPNAFLWEHRDYRELRQVERHRLHLPLRTNSSAFLVTGGTKVHLASGGIWRLAPVHAHGVCNLLGPDRIHLIADVYHDAAYRRLAAKASLHRSQVEPLPAATPDVLNDRLGAARQLASLGFTDAAEWLLLRLFYRHAMPEGAVYDLIARMYEESGDSQTASRWLSTKHTVLALGPARGSPPPNDKEKLAPGVVPELPREAPDGTQRDLPVVGMAACPGLAARLTGIFTDTAAITHLLLSGAAGAGDAVCDGADLDLIVGVADVMLPAIVAVIDDLMRVRAGALLPGWHDRRRQIRMFSGSCSCFLTMANCARSTSASPPPPGSPGFVSGRQPPACWTGSRPAKHRRPVPAPPPSSPGVPASSRPAPAYWPSTSFWLCSCTDGSAGALRFFPPGRPA